MGEIPLTRLVKNAIKTFAFFMCASLQLHAKEFISFQPLVYLFEALKTKVYHFFVQSSLKIIVISVSQPFYVVPFNHG